MDNNSRILLAVASRVLSYPTDEYSQDQADVMEAIRDELEPEGLRIRVINAVTPLYALPLQAAREDYVATFDLKEKTGLYLTAHEFGDGRKRGVELIALQNLIQDHGFLFRADELADFMPMLYEFIAAAEDNHEAADQLRIRLSRATERIHKNLAEDNLYLPMFDILMDVVFEMPTAEELEKMEQGREKPDLDPMPYPLMY